MNSVSMRWTWAAISRPAKIVNGLLEIVMAFRPTRVFDETGLINRNVINGPMTPCSRRSVGIVA